MNEEQLNLKILEEVIPIYEKFFGIKLKKIPEVIILNSREEISKQRKKETPDWLVGWQKNNKIYLLSRKNYEKESSHKYSEGEYNNLIKHELVHAFTESFIPDCKINICWLWEGIAICLSGQNYMKKKVTRLNKFLNSFWRAEEECYRESGFAVKTLIDHDKNKFLKLLKKSGQIKDEDELKNLFKKIYGSDLKYEWFNKSNK